MRALVFALFCGIAACKPAPRPAAPALDPRGAMLLDPLRNQALHPETLIGWLALAPNAVVADVGSGPGFLTLPLARAVPSGRVIATDVRGDYLEALAARAKQAGLRNIEVRRTSKESPELGPRSIDLALLCQVDQYLPDRVAYLRAVSRALKPDGRIALVNFRKFLDADRAAAAEASLAILDERAPSPPFFLLLLAPKGAR